MSWHRRALFAVALGVAWGSLGVPTSARPVPIGRYVEVPYGIDPRAPWVTEGGDAGRSGRARHAAPEAAPALAWEVRVGVGTVSGTAVAADGVVYAATAAGLTALAPDGSLRWTFELRFPLGAPSITPGGALLLATRRGEVTRVSPAGEGVGRAEVGAVPSAPPLVLDDGSVVIATREATLERIDSDGRRRFRVPLPDVARRPLAWDGRRIVVAAGTEVLYLATDGTVRARAAVAQGIVAGPATATDGTVWVLAGDGTLSAFDRDGRLRARASVGPVAAASPLVVGADGAARFGTRDGALVCVGPTGTERWRFDQGGPFLDGMAVDPAGVTLAVGRRGALVAVGPDGKMRWSVATRPRTGSDPVVAGDGTVYVGTSAGTVQAFR